MKDIISIEKFKESKQSNFQTFLNDNKKQIYAMTPKVNTISKNDEWVDETEWDDLYKELCAKES